MQIRARDIVLVDPKQLKRNPKNRNKHSEEQIEHLVKQFEYQGFRQPVVVSNRSGLVVAGHGRLEAALKMGAEKIPAVYQDFETEELEYAFGIADNSTADWAELDLSGINLDLPELGPDFDIDLLGIKDFSLDPSDAGPPARGDQGAALDNFLNNDMRYLQVVYPLDIYDHVVSRLDSLCEEKGFENYSHLIADLIGVNYAHPTSDK